MPRDRLPKSGIHADLAYELIHDHLMLDGNARLNLATLVGTWMEPEARRLMEECADKNIIDITVLEAIACLLADSFAAMPPLRLISHPLGQLPVFAVSLDPSGSNWTVSQLLDKLRERGWQIPAYTLPADCESMAVLRFVVRTGGAGAAAGQFPSLSPARRRCPPPILAPMDHSSFFFRGRPG